MIYIIQNITNQVPVVVERNNPDMSDDVYLWEMKHKLTLETWYFIPYKIIPSVTYKPGYDLFCIKSNLSAPQVLTGATGCETGNTVCNVHLIPGEYYVKIYSQSQANNLNPLLSDYLVYETQGLLVGINQDIPITYSGNSDIFIVYNEDND